MITHALGYQTKLPPKAIRETDLYAELKLTEIFWRRSTGIWYDPQDLTTLFQDAAGTLPVYRPGTGLVDPSVGLMLDKGQGLELGPELVTGSFDTWYFAGACAEKTSNSFTTTGTGGLILADPVNFLNTKRFLISVQWVKSDGVSLFSVRPIPSSDAISSTADTGEIVARSNFGISNDLYLRLAEAGTITITSISVREIKGYHAYQNTTTARPTLSGRYNLLTATETLSTQSVTTAATNYTLSFSGAGTVTLSGTATGTYSAGTHTITCTAGTLTCTVAGAVTRADLRVSNDTIGLPVYQRVDSATTYDTAGFPLYLRFDGVDDFLQTASVDLTGTDEITIGAGSQRFGGENYNYIRVYEFSVDAGLNAGTFIMMSPETNSNNNTLFNSIGSVASAEFLLTGNTVGSKLASVYATKFSTDFKSITINGGIPSTLTADSGTGAFGNYPLFIGARGDGPACFFNGRFYSLCIIGSLLSTSEQAVLERYLNAKTRAY